MSRLEQLVEMRTEEQAQRINELENQLMESEAELKETHRQLVFWRQSAQDWRRSAEFHSKPKKEIIKEIIEVDEIQLEKPLGRHRWAWRRAWGVWRVCWHCRTLQRRGRAKLVLEALGILWRSYRLAQRQV